MENSYYNKLSNKRCSTSNLYALLQPLKNISFEINDLSVQEFKQSIIPQIKKYVTQFLQDTTHYGAYDASLNKFYETGFKIIAHALKKDLKKVDTGYFFDLKDLQYLYGKEIITFVIDERIFTTCWDYIKGKRLLLDYRDGVVAVLLYAGFQPAAHKWSDGYNPEEKRFIEYDAYVIRSYFPEDQRQRWEQAKLKFDEYYDACKDNPEERFIIEKTDGYIPLKRVLIKPRMENRLLLIKRLLEAGAHSMCYGDDGYHVMSSAFSTNWYEQGALETKHALVILFFEHNAEINRIEYSDRVTILDKCIKPIGGEKEQTLCNLLRKIGAKTFEELKEENTLEYQHYKVKDERISKWWEG